jgi:hypothetical protein
LTVGARLRALLETYFVERLRMEARAAGDQHRGDDQIPREARKLAAVSDTPGRTTISTINRD